MADPPTPVREPADPPTTGGDRVLSFLAYLTLWGFLTGGEPFSWILGIPAALVAAALPRWLGSTRAPADRSASIEPSPHASSWWPVVLALPRFGWWFFLLSISAGWDVARRAFAPKVRVDPALLRYPLRLPDGAPRFLFMLVITLVPGTLTADAQGNELVVHVLDQKLDNHRDLLDLEERVARLFGMDLPPSGPCEGAP